MGQLDAGGGVSDLHQARAVVADVVGGCSPHVGLTELGSGCGQDLRASRTIAAAATSAASTLGLGDFLGDLLDVVLRLRKWRDTPVLLDRSRAGVVGGQGQVEHFTLDLAGVDELLHLGGQGAHEVSLGVDRVVGVHRVGGPVSVAVLALCLPGVGHELCESQGSGLALGLGLPGRLLADLDGDHGCADLGADLARAGHVGLVLGRHIDRYRPVCFLLVLTVLASAARGEHQRHGQGRHHQKRSNNPFGLHRCIPSPRARGRCCWGVCVGLPPSPPPSDGPDVP